MNSDQIKLCQTIMQKISRRPVAKMFLTISPLESKSKQISLQSIAERLQQNKYQNADEWIYEMRRLFSVEIKQPTNSLRSSAARLLMNDFEEEMKILSPMLSPHLFQFQMAEEHLQNFINSYHPYINKTPPKTEKEPAAEIFKEDFNDIDYTARNLFSDIQLIREPQIILRVAAFIYKIHPSAISIGKQLTMMFSVLSKDELWRVGKFVRQLMLDSSVGKINTLIQTPGIPAHIVDMRCTNFKHDF